MPTTRIKGSAPFEQKCPKCGAPDVYHRLRAKDESYDPIYGHQKWLLGTSWVKTSSTFGREYFTKECIVHHCRCCSYEWATSPLKTAV